MIHLSGAAWGGGGVGEKDHKRAGRELLIIMMVSRIQGYILNNVL